MLAFGAKILAAIIPWAGPRSVLGLAVGALFVVTTGAVWLAGNSHGTAKSIAAVSRCETKWRDALANSERQYNARIAEARAAAAAVGPVPADDAGIGRLCEQSAACRERGGIGAR